MKKGVAQCSIFLFLLYLLWYAEAFETIPILLYGGTFVVAMATMYYINGRKWSDIYLPSEIQCWILFGIYSAVTGLVVATNRSMLISSLITYFAFIFVIVCCICVIRGEGSSAWLLKQIVAVSLLCAIYTLFRGYDYYNGVIVRTMGPNNNPNTLGALMVFGTFSLLYISEPKMKSLIRNAIPLFLFLYVVILTGSKKALLSECILMCFWVFGLCKGLRNSERLSMRICAYGVIALCVVAVLYYFTTYYINTASFIRMQTLTTSGSTNTRAGMYQEAFEMFKRNPLFGVGYNHFRVLSRYGTYSHATYSELIANSGLIGMIIFIYPIVVVGKKLLARTTVEWKYQKYTLISIYAVEIFLGAVNIFFYEFSHLLMWSIIFMETQHLYTINRYL